MKVQLVTDCKGPNPKYNRRAAELAAADGKEYAVPKTITIPAGTVIEHPKAYYLCQPGYKNEPAKAVPLDEPAQKKFQGYLKHRLKAIALLRVQLQALPKDKAARQHILDLAEAYGLELPEDEPQTDAADEAEEDTE